jgi:hypothetical protein
MVETVLPKQTGMLRKTELKIETLFACFVHAEDLNEPFLFSFSTKSCKKCAMSALLHACQSACFPLPTVERPNHFCAICRFTPYLKAYKFFHSRK